MTRRRLLPPFIGCLALFALLGMRLCWIQVVRHGVLEDRAQRQYHRVLKTQSPRGPITDRSGHVLAMSLEVASCFVDLSQVREPVRAAAQLSRVLGRSVDWRLWQVHGGRRFHWVARRLPSGISQEIETLHLLGVGTLWEPQRVYPEGQLACHVLGVVGTDQQGLAGVEFTAERTLRGPTVEFRVERDALGRTIATRGPQDRPPSRPALALTIDRTLQYLAEQILEQGMRETRAKQGILVALDPRTGELLALVNRPGFDPNQWQGDLPILANGAVSRIFEPGSTFKLVAAAAALEEQLVGWDEPFFCERGKFEVSGFTIHDHEPHGELPFHQVMAYSSNIGIAKLGVRIGRERFYRMARAFGFGALSGSGLPGETPGLLRSPGRWSQLSLPMMAFGQEVGVTALQIVNAYAAVANGGVLLEPRILRGDVVTTSPRIIRRVCHPNTSDALTRLLEEVVTSGTGGKAQVAGFRVAGKTGTAQKFDPQLGRYSPTRYLASFCGFLPVEAPRLVIGVFIDEPHGVYWGGEVAAPLFARFAAQAMQHLGIRPTAPGPTPALAAATTYPPSSPSRSPSGAQSPPGLP